VRYSATLAASVVALAFAGTATLATGAVGPSAPARRPAPHLLAAPAASRSAAPVVAPTTTTTTAPTTTTVPAASVATSTLLAAPEGTIPTYVAPGGPPVGSVGTWYGYNLVLPVVARQPGWLDVRLPQRPNESTAWVRADDVALSSTPWYIVVNLTTLHMTVYRAGQAVMSFPVGVGVAATPTVTGHYFVAVHEPHGDPLYGPVILDTSAHSDAIQSWEGMGDAIIAIHGPIDAEADAEIGTTGAHVSNGCIRLHDADLEQLTVIPPGTPVDIDP
jgi:lipoprotein-anchoring transpeptidase ErfK/SrfK